MPVPPLDGGAQVMHFTTMGLIVNQVQVKTIAINPSRNHIDISSLPREYIEQTRFEAVEINTDLNPLRSLTNLFRKESYFIERFISENFEKKLISALTETEFDMVQLEHLYLCKYIPVIRTCSNARIILRAQNVEYVIWERYMKSVRNPLKKFLLGTAINRLRNYERYVRSIVDGIIALTKEDAEIFSSCKGHAPVIVVPMGYDYSRLGSYDYELQFQKEPVVYHLGAMDWMPNAEAMRWFLEKVLPILQEKNATVKIVIAGKKMPSWIWKYRSEFLEIEGEITDPLKFQMDKAIMIVPLWSGSGIRAKIIEGLALGKTIISTSIGAQGIEYEYGTNLLIADTPEDFAGLIIQYAGSKKRCMEISRNARELSIEKYHYSNTARMMIRFYDQIHRGKP